MAEMEWSSFLAAHYRAHLIVAETDELAPADAAAAAQSILRLMTSLEAVGNFAIAQGAAHLRIALEEDRDASRLRMALNAHAAEATSDWSSVAHVRLDKAAMRRIAAASR